MQVPPLYFISKVLLISVLTTIALASYTNKLKIKKLQIYIVIIFEARALCSYFFILRKKLTKLTGLELLDILPI